MIVRIGDTYYNSNTTPILVVLTHKEKSVIKQLSETDNIIVSFPEKGYTKEEIQEFMNMNNIKDCLNKQKTIQ
jgi:hypothetical protein